MKRRSSDGADPEIQHFVRETRRLRVYAWVHVLLVGLVIVSAVLSKVGPDRVRRGIRAWGNSLRGEAEQQFRLDARLGQVVLGDDRVEFRVRFVEQDARTAIRLGSALREHSRTLTLDRLDEITWTLNQAAATADPYIGGSPYVSVELLHRSNCDALLGVGFAVGRSVVSRMLLHVPGVGSEWIDVDEKGMDLPRLCRELGLTMDGRRFLPESHPSDLHAYGPVHGLKFAQLAPVDVVLAFRDRLFRVEFHRYIREPSDLQGATIEDFVRVSVQFFAWASSRGYRVQDCGNRIHLDLVFVEYEELNDRQRFSGYASAGDEDFRIYGLFDRKGDGVHQVGIFMSRDLEGRYKSVTFAHELAHYWFDRLCLDDQGAENEPLAREFDAEFRSSGSMSQ